MKKKVGYFLLASVSAGCATAAMFSWDLGSGTTPLAKFFLVFFGAIIVLQGIPALLLFAWLVKGLFSSPTEAESQTLLVKNQSNK